MRRHEKRMKDKENKKTIEEKEAYEYRGREGRISRQGNERRNKKTGKRGKARERKIKIQRKRL